jgi:hypothetical protein
MQLASFSPYPQSDLAIPGRSVQRIHPLIEFDDTETRLAAEKIGFPIIPDICKELWGSGFEQDRRFLSKYIEILTRSIPPNSYSPTSMLGSYRSLISGFTRLGFLPPVEELNGAALALCDPKMAYPPAYQFARYDQPTTTKTAQDPQICSL